MMHALFASALFSSAGGLLPWLAARTAIRHDEAMKRYYQRKIAQGKQHGVAINNVKNKLLHIAYALVRNGQDYQSGHVINGEAA